jgi:hypothetical protein
MAAASCSETANIAPSMESWVLTGKSGMKVSDDVRRCAPRGLWRGEGAPGGAAGGLADDAERRSGAGAGAGSPRTVPSSAICEAKLDFLPVPVQRPNAPAPSGRPTWSHPVWSASVRQKPGPHKPSEQAWRRSTRPTPRPSRSSAHGLNRPSPHRPLRRARRRTRRCGVASWPTKRLAPS